jgi:hypothetical protein
VGQVREEPPVLLDKAPEGLGLVQREVVLGPAAGAGQVDVLDLVGAVVLGSSLQVGVTDHPHLLEEVHGSIHGRGVDRRQPPLHPPGHVLGRDVTPRAEDLPQDGLALRRDAVPPHPQHGDDRGGLLVHSSRLLQQRCR